MKKIGFIDLYIAEWHAYNYPAWIKEAAAKLGVDYEVVCFWSKEEVSPDYPTTTDEWSKEMNIKRVATIEEVCKECDNVIILAPSNPEVHLDLVKATFPLAKGKRLYIDKTFAPDLETAKEIYRLAEENDIAFFSTSALRYASELDGHVNCEKATILGGGRNLPEYIIHQTEMLVKVMGTNPKKAKTETREDGDFCTVVFADGREATMHFAPANPFHVTLTDGGVEHVLPINSDFFKTLMEKMLVFFETGNIDFSKEETLAVMSIREGVIKSQQNNGAWVEL